MICPKCGCRIRIQTDVCPFCGLVLPAEYKETYDATHPVKNKFEAKRIVKKRNLLSFPGFLRNDDLPASKRSELYHEIIIMLLFVLIITSIIQIIILLKI